LVTCLATREWVDWMVGNSPDILASKLGPAHKTGKYKEKHSLKALCTNVKIVQKGCKEHIQ
jgi:hypothetical protein